MKNNKLVQNVIIALTVIVLGLMLSPGQGMKAQSQQAIVATDYSCNVDKDCPKCVGGGVVDYNVSDDGFFGELSYAKCLNKKCQLSDACLLWDCGGVNTVEPNSCKSIRQSLLDNTLGKINQNPFMLLLLVGLLAAYFYLDKGGA